MKALIQPPFFEIGVKNYLYGDAVLELAKAADSCAEECDVDVLFIAPYVDIRRIAENTRRLIIFAPYMDVLRPGRGIAHILPESLKAAGAHGVVVNHSERPMSLSAIRETIDRANELDLLTFACADTIQETRAVAQFHPDILNPEPSELIGTTGGGDLDFMYRSVEAVKSVSTQILVEQAAGITSGDQVYKYISAGAEGVGVASGIAAAADPIATMTEMIRAVKAARDDLAQTNHQ